MWWCFLWFSIERNAQQTSKVEKGHLRGWWSVFFCREALKPPRSFFLASFCSTNKGLSNKKKNSYHARNASRCTSRGTETATKQTVKQPTARFDPRTFRFRNLDRYQQRSPHVVWRTRIHLFWRTRIHLFVCECVVCGCVSVWGWLCVCEVRAEFFSKLEA